MNHYPTVNRIAFKPDVRLTGASLDAEPMDMLSAAMRTAPQLGDDTLVVTSACDSRHGPHSLHYVSRAFDIRFTGNRIGGIVVDWDDMGTPGLERQRQAARMWAGRMRQQLGGCYDVVVEGDHIHVEWDTDGS